MAQESWPSPAHNSRQVTDLEYEKLAARYSDDGIYGTPADTAVVSAGTGLTVNIRPNVYGSLRGHAWSSGPDTITLPVSANAASSTRTDRVVLRLDRATWTVRAAVKEGVPGAGAPALSQSTDDTGTYEIGLAEVGIRSGAGSVTVTRKELYVGTRLRPATSTTRNPSPMAGELVYETDTGITRLWTGSSWQSVLDDSGEIDIGSPLSAWSSSAQHILQRRNGSVHVRLAAWTREADTLSSSGDSRLPVLIPAAYRHPTRDQVGLAYISGGALARFIIYSAVSDRPGQVWLVNHPGISKGTNVLPQSGLSWVVG